MHVVKGHFIFCPKARTGTPPRDESIGKGQFLRTARFFLLIGLRRQREKLLFGGVNAPKAPLCKGSDRPVLLAPLLGELSRSD